MLLSRNHLYKPQQEQPRSRSKSIGFFPNNLILKHDPTHFSYLSLIIVFYLKRTMLCTFTHVFETNSIKILSQSGTSFSTIL